MSFPEPMEDTEITYPPDIEQAPKPKIKIQEYDPASTLESVRRKEHLFTQTMAAVQRDAFSPEHTKVLKRTWQIGRAAEMVGTSRQTIRLKESKGDLTPPAKDANGRHAAYTLQDINRMRDYFGTRPYRGPTDEPAVVSFSTFKGGCGKSTMSVHFAQAMAIKGYRVLFIDCDPQGSATTLFGVNPDLPDVFIPGMDGSPDEPEENGPDLKFSLAEFLAREVTEFAPLIDASYFPGIDLVPANMDLAGAEYQLAADVSDNAIILNDLRDGIRSVWHDYDIVVLDPPPALGLLSLEVLNAANALIIPMRPTVIDFASTAKFMSMLHSNLEGLIEHGFPIHYHFQSILINDLNDRKAAQVEIVEAMNTVFSGVDLLAAQMKDSAEIDSAGKEMMTVYDLTEPMQGYDTYRRCVSYLDRVNDEIETKIRRTWPSHKQKLRDEAHI